MSLHDFAGQRRISGKTILKKAGVGPGFSLMAACSARQRPTLNLTHLIRSHFEFLECGFKTWRALIYFISQVLCFQDHFCLLVR